MRHTGTRQHAPPDIHSVTLLYKFYADGSSLIVPEPVRDALSSPIALDPVEAGRGGPTHLERPINRARRPKQYKGIRLSEARLREA